MGKELSTTPTREKLQAQPHSHPTLRRQLYPGDMLQCQECQGEPCACTERVNVALHTMWVNLMEPKALQMTWLFKNVVGFLAPAPARQLLCSCNLSSRPVCSPRVSQLNKQMNMGERIGGKGEPTPGSVGAWEGIVVTYVQTFFLVCSFQGQDGGF